MLVKKSLFCFILFILFGMSQVSADFGNWFVANKRLSTSLESSKQKLSYRFTCQDDMDLTAAAVYCVKALNSPAYLISLQDDNGGSPSGTALSSSSFVPRTETWTTIPLGSTPLRKGRIYHLVLEHDSFRGGGHPVGEIGVSHCASFLSTDVLNHLHPNDGSPDPQTNVLFFEGNHWKPLNQEPVYAVYGAGGNIQGNPYDDPGIRPIFGNGDSKDKSKQVLQGESLHFHCGFMANNLVIRIKKQGKPEFPLNYIILKHNFQIHKTIPIYSAVVAAPGQISGDFKWVTIGFDDKSKTNFSPECWFLVLQTDSGTSSKNSSGCEDCYLLSDVGNSGGLADAANLTFDGGAHLSRLVYSLDGGSSLLWKDEFERDANLGTTGPLCPAAPQLNFEPIATPPPLLDMLQRWKRQ